MKVKDLMHRGVKWVGPDESILHIARIMRDQDIGAVPVGENDRLIGIITDRDIVVRSLALNDDPLQMTARDVMSSPIRWCHEDEHLSDALEIMEERQIRRLPVLDKHKRMTGMLSLGDIAAEASPKHCSETLRAVSSHHQ